MSADNVGRDARIDPSVEFRGADSNQSPPDIGDDATIRSGSTIYPDVTVGDGFRTGHGVLVRSGTSIGDDVLLGTDTVVDGRCTIGDGVSVQTGVYIPPETAVGDRVFLGPRAVLTNDEYPLREPADLDGPTLERDVTIGANATLLPGITVGERAFVAAGTVVTEDVPERTLAVGSPAEFRPLPDRLDTPNTHR